MSVSIKAQLTPEALEVIARYKGAPTRLFPVMQRAMNGQNNRLLAKILPQRFSGKGPFPPEQHRLGEVTGHLYDSIRATDAVVNGGGVSSGIGSNLKYFAIHEFGFNGQVVVNAHLRTMVQKRIAGRLQSTRELGEAGLLNKHGAIKPGAVKKGKVAVTLKKVTVDQYTRWMQMPDRSPLQTGIRENLTEYARGMSAAIVADLGGHPAPTISGI
jgi:hypothetical protein